MVREPQVCPGAVTKEVDRSVVILRRAQDDYMAPEKEMVMKGKKVAVRLHPRLAEEGRGLCDPEEPRNEEVITPLNYGTRGYLRVYPSGFIRAQIQAGILIRVPEGEKTGAAKGRSQGKKTASRQGAKRSPS